MEADSEEEGEYDLQMDDFSGPQLPGGLPTQSYYDSDEPYQSSIQPVANGGSRSSIAGVVFLGIRHPNLPAGGSRSNSSATLTTPMPAHRPQYTGEYDSEEGGFSSSAGTVVSKPRQHTSYLDGPSPVGSGRHALGVYCSFSADDTIDEEAAGDFRRQPEHYEEAEVIEKGESSQVVPDVNYEAQLAAAGRRYDSRQPSTSDYLLDGYATGGEGGNHTTPTPTYEEYRRTPNRFSIDRNGGLVPAVQSVDMDITPTHQQDDEPCYFNDNYAEEEDTTTARYLEPAVKGEAQEELKQEPAEQRVPIIEEENNIFGRQMSLQQRRRQSSLDTFTPLPIPSINEPMPEVTEEKEPSPNQKDYKDLWKWAYREACKRAGIQIKILPRNPIQLQMHRTILLTISVSRKNASAGELGGKNGNRLFAHKP
uniref:Uncharacterized protein n=1 Tax=Ditylenchus dipsaci TaxID=166011 RepID=A0A915DEU5_9BILA